MGKELKKCLSEAVDETTLILIGNGIVPISISGL